MIIEYIIGRMKKLTVLGTILVALLVFSTHTALAREGMVSMSNKDVACEAISLWREGRYRVTGRCEGLVYPYATQYNYYTLWAKTDDKGETVRVGQVDKGYFDGGVGKGFSNLYITAETESLPRRPSDKAIVSGKISAFAFDKSLDTTIPAATPAPATSNGQTMTVQQGSSSTAGSTVGTVIGKIVRSLLIIIAVVVVLVIGTSLVFRRRGSVSG